jgi:hypothetical protein
MLQNYNKNIDKTYHILNHTRIKPRSRPPQKENPHILRTPIFSGQNKKNTQITRANTVIIIIIHMEVAMSRAAIRRLFLEYVKLPTLTTNMLHTTLLSDRHGLGGITYCYRLETSDFELRWNNKPWFSSHLCRPTLGPAQRTVKWAPGLVPGGKAAEAWRWPPTPTYGGS